MLEWTTSSRAGVAQPPPAGMASQARAPVPPWRGMTLMEVLIALFIFMVGIVGVLAALPTGVNAAHWVIFQDAAIHLSSSKFSEFRRDHVNPAVDLTGGSGYMTSRQEPPNGNPGDYRDFAHGPGDTYEYFDAIERYEWKVDESELRNVGVDAAVKPSSIVAPFNPDSFGHAPLGTLAPVEAGGAPLEVTRVTVVVHYKGTSKEFRFTQYMLAYE